MAEAIPLQHSPTAKTIAKNKPFIFKPSLRKLLLLILFIMYWQYPTFIIPSPQNFILKKDYGFRNRILSIVLTIQSLHMTILKEDIYGFYQLPEKSS